MCITQSVEIPSKTYKIISLVTGTYNFNIGNKKRR